MKKRIFSPFLLLKLSTAIFCLSLAIILPIQAAEGDTRNINLRIEGPTQNIINTQIALPEQCVVTDASTANSYSFSGYKAICALEQAKLDGLINSYEVSDFGFGLFINGINGIGGGENMFWSLYQNNGSSLLGATDLELNDGDEMLMSYVNWNYGNEVLYVSPSATSTLVGDQIELIAKQWSGSDLIDFNSTSTFFINSIPFVAASGFLEYTPTEDGELKIYVEAEGKTRSSIQTITVAQAPQPTAPAPDPIVNLVIRFKDQIIFDGIITVPSTTTFLFTNTDDNSTTVTSTGKTALAALLAADATSTSFEVSDISYYSAYNSIIVNCLRFGAPTSTNGCYDWQYVVNGEYPLGMDGYVLNGSEQMNFYFGSRYSLSLDKTQYTEGESVSSTLEEYDYQNGLYILKPQSILGFLDTADAVIATSTTSEDGTAVFFPTATGTYKIGLENISIWGNYYWPTVSFNVADSPAIVIIPPSPTGGGGGGYSVSHNKIDISKAASFLSSLQNSDGSFGSAMYTDWAAIAFSSLGGENETRNKIKNYLLTDPSVAGGPNEVSNNVRRAMALMTLGINPYYGVKTNYIQKIIDSYDGSQFKDVNYPNDCNDDIFALFPLLKGGYSISDSLVTSTIKFILEQQSQNGSWGSVDLTAAAIQALSLAISMDGVGEAINNAKTYLHFAQSDDGGFGNSFATSWALQAITSLGESESNWTKNNKTPNDYLYSQQQSDGGIENFSAPTSTRLWATAFAVPAAAGKSWNQLLNNFNKPSVDVAAGNSGGGVGGYPVEIHASLLVYPTSTTPTTSVVLIAAPTTALKEKISINAAGIKKTVGRDENIKSVSISTPQGENNNNNQIVDEPRLLTLSQANAPDNKDNIVKIVDELPINASTRRTAKRIMVVSGGSAVAVGLYLGLKFLKNVV